RTRQCQGMTIFVLFAPDPLASSAVRAFAQKGCRNGTAARPVRPSRRTRLSSGAAAAHVEVELDREVLLAECLAGVGEGFGFQPLVQRAQVGRWCGGDTEYELRAGRVANDAAPDG